MTDRSLTVVEPGPLTTVQDAGRVGLAALGIGRSGACDRASHGRANRLVANDPRAATLEVTHGGLVVEAGADLMMAIAGARCPDVPHNAVFALRAGARLRLPAPDAGLRTYVAVRGGIAVAETLGSRSTDVLAGIGPDPIRAGDVLPVGEPTRQFPVVDVAPASDPESGEVTVRVVLGPRADWFGDRGLETLLHEAFAVTSESNRIGIRLDGPVLERVEDRELPSEGMARGALQVPPSGKPVLFLADHPVTGGYPVVAYVRDEDVDRCAQLGPGQRVRFRGPPGRPVTPRRPAGARDRAG